MTLVCDSRLPAPLRTLALLARDGRAMSDAASSRPAQQDRFGRAPSQVPRVAHRAGSAQYGVDDGPGLRRAPTFTQHSGSLWDGDVARKHAGEGKGVPLSRGGRSISQASRPLRSPTIGSVPTSETIYRRTAPAPQPPALLQTAGRDLAGSDPGAFETTVGRLVNANLSLWEKQHLAPRRLAELTSRSLEQQLRRERERLGV